MKFSGSPVNVWASLDTEGLLLGTDGLMDLSGLAAPVERPLTSITTVEPVAGLGGWAGLADRWTTPFDMGVGGEFDQAMGLTARDPFDGFGHGSFTAVDQSPTMEPVWDPFEPFPPAGPRDSDVVLATEPPTVDLSDLPSLPMGSVSYGYMVVEEPNQPYAMVAYIE